MWITGIITHQVGALAFKDAPVGIEYHAANEEIEEVSVLLNGALAQFTAVKTALADIMRTLP